MSHDVAIEVFNRMIAEADFAKTVADDDDALDGLDLSDPERKALVADAGAMAGEVSGFQSGFTVTPAQFSFKLADLLGPETFRERIKLGPDGPRR